LKEHGGITRGSHKIVAAHGDRRILAIIISNHKDPLNANYDPNAMLLKLATNKQLDRPRVPTPVSAWKYTGEEVEMNDEELELVAAIHLLEHRVREMEVEKNNHELLTTLKQGLVPFYNRLDKLKENLSKKIGYSYPNSYWD